MFNQSTHVQITEHWWMPKIYHLTNIIDEAKETDFMFEKSI